MSSEQFFRMIWRIQWGKPNFFCVAKGTFQPFFGQWVHFRRSVTHTPLSFYDPRYTLPLDLFFVVPGLWSILCGTACMTLPHTWSLMGSVRPKGGSYKGKSVVCFLFSSLCASFFLCYSRRDLENTEPLYSVWHFVFPVTILCFVRALFEMFFPDPQRVI